jgi:hypothetical protein
LADRRGGTIDREVLATNSRGHQNGTKIRCARVSIITVTRLTTALATSLTNITPIIVRAVNLKGSRKCNFREDSMTFTIEEIKPIVISRGNLVRGSDSIESKGSRLSSVDTTQIHGHEVVDKDVKIIITKEIKNFTTLV